MPVFQNSENSRKEGTSDVLEGERMAKPEPARLGYQKKLEHLKHKRHQSIRYLFWTNRKERFLKVRPCPAYDTMQKFRKISERTGNVFLID
jgi:hypothetical protein